ncbi:hypothetical protein BDP81DRAFT_417890 [Colletotrichum phormii]|uniref:Uncharacterized protein n=1 Tax=Colletotrichum phormii TaxID=359342 RepID=A0AAJ0EJH0_9PEZI|nr:uncharacterized protein BDP81DRAFT_417890 [Colletotrichum phormii]KAK1641019.1 hypothetical protein BDP81DRAFT_417890 [Colletotrichum phormii]
MIADAEFSRSGLLSCEPARILLETSDAFTPAYILTLNVGEVGEGDSGAWVVGSSSHDVFGHTIAADMFGDAYIVPLDQTFADIQRSLGAESVHLPSPQDCTFEQVFSGHFRSLARGKDVTSASSTTESSL